MCNVPTATLGAASGRTMMQPTVCIHHEAPRRSLGRHSPELRKHRVAHHQSRSPSASSSVALTHRSESPAESPAEVSISKSEKVSINFTSTRQSRQTSKAHVNLRKNGLRDGSMAYPKNPTSERWEGGPTHPIPCNPREVSAGSHRIGGVALPDIDKDPMQTFMGWHGLFSVVGGGNLGKPTPSKRGRATSP